MSHIEERRIEERTAPEEGRRAHVDHHGHEAVFRRRFWVCLVLSVPVLYFSPFVQESLGYTALRFPGSDWITPVLAVVVFSYGGFPFLSMARVEFENREPG
jgi:P-type Cu2+ transporter